MIFVLPLNYARQLVNCCICAKGRKRNFVHISNQNTHLSNKPASRFLKNATLFRPEFPSEMVDPQGRIRFVSLA
jgi:hypothetical protein